ncbi:MAG TPA: sigma-70 family RNA polymerase sigma factor [Opitutaceae bacterium]|nr:sigma-70 family RNA polymerase sigma factor [Opitutaceae bacterium]
MTAETETVSAASRPDSAQSSEIVEHFFREQSRRLYGTLTRILGPRDLSIIEDVVQEACFRALRTWSIGGIPDNPAGWITRVAINLARDAMRRTQMATTKEAALIAFFEQQESTPLAAAAGDGKLPDDSLRLLFVCCHPSISPEAQVMLSLKVLCGFTTRQIAVAFTSSDAAVEKQLARTKRRIRELGMAFDLPEGEELALRLNSAHIALYLLFNEGYKASSGERPIHEELCREAIRLTVLLLDHPVGRTPRSHALLALMLLTAARFPSRLSMSGDLLRLTDQDRTKWDQALINRGLFHLGQSAEGDDFSEYHVQAGIAATHCIAPSYESTDWSQILELYDRLVAIKPTAIVALNRAVALSHVKGPEAALAALETIGSGESLKSHYLFHAVTGELHSRLNHHERAADCFRQALNLAELRPEQAHFERQLERLYISRDHREREVGHRPAESHA